MLFCYFADFCIAIKSLLNVTKLPKFPWNNLVSELSNGVFIAEIL